MVKVMLNLRPLSLSLEQAKEFTRAVGELLSQGNENLRQALKDGKGGGGRTLDELEEEAHTLSILAIYHTALEEMIRYGERMASRSDRDLECLLVHAFCGFVSGEIRSTLHLGPLERISITSLGLDPIRFWNHLPETTRNYLEDASSPALLREIALLIEERGGFGDFGIEDETLLLMQGEIRKFVAEEVAPIAHKVHLEDRLIPMELIEKLSELGVFGLTIPERYGGSGLGKLAMVVVTEELSRGYIGVGSLGTRSEIAGELILHGGTEKQKETCLPRIARGEILPTAVFTEPQNGSDLARLKTRAERVPGGFRLYGQKTWITHASRADLMTILVRTLPQYPDHRGLSILLGEKPRFLEELSHFRLDGLEGTELRVLGYRGMKEYELSFDGFFIPEENLLGGVEGEGFKQLMRTFESARIQTAARSVGVAMSALEEGFRYAQDRIQFGRKIYEFPRVFCKIARAATLIQTARQLTYYSARAKDSGKRCDLEAGMAKLFAGMVAWEVADAMLQIHGGNGYSLEFPISRILCDARVLSIFEGASEIQAHVIARRILESAGA
jgi:(2S)-methylsuccinyl-CoA dehydrogenase